MQAVPKRYELANNVVSIASGPRNAIAVAADGRVLAWGDNASGQLGIARLSTSPTPLNVRDPLAPYAGADLTIEYFNPTVLNGAGNPGIGHYFITAAAAEAASIDAGGSGPGWSRTGRTFRVWNDPARAAMSSPKGAVRSSVRVRPDSARRDSASG